VSCSPPSGGTFAIGTTAVGCTATDDAGNVSAGSFNIVVRGAAEQLVDLIDKTLAIKGLGPVSPGLRSQLQTVFSCVVLRSPRLACLGLDLYVYAVRLASTVRWISTSQMNSLVTDAQRIKAVIGC
jgi:hypothetical protein